MEFRGETSGVKPVDVDTDSSELSTSTASNTMLPHLEATDAKRGLNDNERRRRKEARKLKREAREREEERAAVPRVEFDKSSSFVLTGLFTPPLG